jgi:hypothetical protein
MRDLVEDKRSKRSVRFGPRLGGGFSRYEMVVDIAVVDGVVAFDNAGVAHGKPAHHPVMDLGFGLVAGRETQRVSVPLAGIVGLDFGLEAHLRSPLGVGCSDASTLPTSRSAGCSRQAVSLSRLQSPERDDLRSRPSSTVVDEGEEAVLVGVFPKSHYRGARTPT